MRAVIAALLIQCLVSAVFLALLAQTPKTNFKAGDHFSCDMNGPADIGPVQVQFLVSRGDERIAVLKTEVKTWDQAHDICTSWNDIGYKLEK